MAVKPYRMAMAGLAATGLFALTACGAAPEEDSGDEAEASFQACMITDSGGVDDKSFNESAWNGMVAAEAANSDIAISVTESSNENDFDPNLLDAVDEGCDVVVGVGGLMRENVEAVAEENPDIAFVTVDGASELENVYSVQFDTAQAAFMAGYLAAAQTETGSVGTWGGMQINEVTIFMDGFAQGVEYHNEQKGTEVEVLGWDYEAQDGSFINDFRNTTAARTVTETLVQQGADIILPVAGPAGEGAVAVALEDDDVSVIWVDADGCVTDPDNCSVYLTTVEKQLADSVTTSVQEAYDGNTGGTYVGTLENDGVGLAPYNEFDGEVSDELKQEIEDIKAGIIDGSIPVESPASPQQ